MFENGQINITHEKVNRLSANPTKWSNTLKEFIGNLPTRCLSVFDNFVGWALKRLIAETIAGCSAHCTHEHEVFEYFESKKEQIGSVR